MPYSFYDPNTRRNLFSHFFDMATPIKSVVDGHSKLFYGTDQANMKIINCKCQGLCESFY